MHIDRITHYPTVIGGKPCIRGLRVTVGTILGFARQRQVARADSASISLPGAEDIDAALAYAAWRLEEREEPFVVLERAGTAESMSHG
jgi:uncharacterized protein (DUF433 family)